MIYYYTAASVLPVVTTLTDITNISQYSGEGTTKEKRSRVEEKLRKDLKNKEM